MPKEPEAGAKTVVPNEQTEPTADNVAQVPTASFNSEPLGATHKNVETPIMVSNTHILPGSSQSNSTYRNHRVRL